ncbi:MAG: metallophosphoesterase [Deltaproteobacteria bacterium]|nr:metallophosphoesterase [Deltaproteobacteria bacterium]
MIFFLVAALSVYTTMHGLVFWAMYPLFSGHRVLTYAVSLLMSLMITAPVAVRILENEDQPRAARLLALVGFNWMGLLFLAFSMFVVIGALELSCRLLATMMQEMRHISCHNPATATGVLIVTLAAGLYGHYEAKHVQTVTVPIVTDKKLGRETLRLAQVSDLHLGLISRDETLTPLISRLKQLQPDLLVVTGDLVDAQINHLDGLSDMWREIRPPLGKFAITGNHEVYAGLEQSLAFMRQCGFTVLRNSGVKVDGSVMLVGLDDEQISGRTAREDEILKSYPSELFTILLKHRPTVSESSLGLFDLQLSGHTHRGQIFPFNFVTGLKYLMQDGLYQLTQGSRLYVSRGTGTWGPPMRVFSPPEITLFEITHSNTPL